MKLRWKQKGKQLAVPASEVRIGGSNPTKPVWVLQYKHKGKWKDVPYVGEKQKRQPKRKVMQPVVKSNISSRILEAVKKLNEA